MGARKAMTWDDVMKDIWDMTEEERRSPVLLCGDGYYFGLCRGDVRKVPKDVGKDVETMSPLKRKHIEPGRTYIHL